jgi:hypothetical protein
MATGGFELDVPDTVTNAAAFGYAGGEDRSAFPKVRVVTIGQCGSHAKVDARIGPVGGKGSGVVQGGADLRGHLGSALARRLPQDRAPKWRPANGGILRRSGSHSDIADAVSPTRHHRGIR